MTDKPTKAATDWEAIEREYRAGQLSVAEIGRQYGVTHVAILKRAKKKEWSRDLSEKVRQEIKARLVTEGLQEARGKVTVETAAARGVQLVREHRADIKALRDAVTKLIAELNTDLDPDEIVEALAQGDPDEAAKAKQKLDRALALGGRAQTASTLANTLKTLIPLEREAFALDAKPDQGEAINVDLTEKSLAKLARFLG